MKKKGFILALMLALLASASAQADTSAQMLPPTTTAETSNACTLGSNSVLFMGASGTGGTSAINCSQKFFVSDSGNYSYFLGNVGIGKNNPNAPLDVNGNASISGTMTVGGTLNVNGNQVWNSAGDLYLNYSAPGNTVYVGNNNSGSDSDTQNLSVPNGQICLNNTCVKRILPSGSNETVGVTAACNSGNNYKDSKSATTTKNHSLCFLTAAQHDARDSNCEISGSVGGLWTVEADAGIAGYAPTGTGCTTNCSMSCYDWQ